MNKTASKLLTVLFAVLIAGYYFIGLMSFGDADLDLGSEFHMMRYLRGVLTAVVIGIPLLKTLKGYEATGRIPVVYGLVVVAAFAAVAYAISNPFFIIRNFFVALWPLVCFYAAKLIIGGSKGGPHRHFIGCYAVYTALTVFLIWFTQESVYGSFSADVVTEAFLFVSSQLIYAFYNRHIGRIVSGRDVAVYTVSFAAIAILWLILHDRLTEIYDTLGESFDEITSDGERANWLAHHLYLFKGVITLDLSVINPHRMSVFADECGLMWLSAKGGIHIGVCLLALEIALAAIMVMYVSNGKNNSGTFLARLIVYFLIAKLAVGILCNLFVVFTGTGLPLLNNRYDILLILYLVMYGYNETECYDIVRV